MQRMDGERLDTMEGDDYGDEEEAKADPAVAISMDEFQDGNEEEDDLLAQKPVPKSIENLFAIKDHASDKGLGGLDGTASEVYMSDLLAGHDIEDFDETEDQNEEDLLALGDAFAEGDIVAQIKDQLYEFSKQPNGADYLVFCVSKLKPEDQELAKRHLKIMIE